MISDFGNGVSLMRGPPCCREWRSLPAEALRSQAQLARQQLRQQRVPQRGERAGFKAPNFIKTAHHQVPVVLLPAS